MTNLVDAFKELGGKVLVTGAGISGVGVARLLSDLGVDVTIADSSDTALSRAAEATGVGTILVNDALGAVGDYSIIVTSPGWRPNSELFVAAGSAGVPVIGDVELCYRLDAAEVFGPKRFWMVVTGTNGKTTTTAMLASMMTHGGHKAEAVGNIGISVADALVSQDRVDTLVAELSSFQLHWSSELTPDVGVLLNLADDHIDWHGSFDAYAEAKAKVLKAPKAVAGIDDEHVRAQIERLGVTPIGFTLNEPKEGQFGVKDGELIDAATSTAPVAVAPAEGIQPPGPAGIYDALAASAAARAAGVGSEAIASALRGFEVAGHRGQVVAAWDGNVAIDNSKATNPHAADTALAGHDSVIWVAGGQLKGAEVDDLIRTHAHRLKAVALLGVDRDIIAHSVARLAPEAVVFATDSTDPKQAMEEVVDFAVAQASGNDAVILAPAAASLDMYTGMGQRGMMFAEAVQQRVN